MGAFAHSLSWVTASKQDLKLMFDYGVCACTDMGTELGTAESRASAAFWDKLGNVSQSTERLEGEMREDFVNDEHVENDFGGNEPHHVFKSMLPVAGMLHIVDNLTHEFTSVAMKHFPAFLEQLKMVVALLSTSHLLNLFVEKCLRSTSPLVLPRLVWGPLRSGMPVQAGGLYGGSKRLVWGVPPP